MVNHSEQLVHFGIHLDYPNRSYEASVNFGKVETFQTQISGDVSSIPNWESSDKPLEEHVPFTLW